MGSFSIQTNVTSLQAQNNLAASAAFQAQTINEVTSGLRIVNSGDDAAGLAVANTLRSDQATLTQGIQNANNGLSTLQTIDGGINNIGTLLDRASTLAAQSASGTFTGSRATLNSEYQSVLGEINRQAQAIGLNTGGTFAKSLSVFVGGGTAGDGATAVQNGTIGIDLSNSAVDGQALGLNGTQASGVAGTDISNGGATTVANILAANGTGGTPEADTSFTFSGAGFSGAASGTNTGAQTIKVDLSGVTDTATLVTAINTAIGLKTTTATGVSTGTPLAQAGIVASVSTDATGKQQLTFSSGTAAFQVQAGDQTANALLGNFNPASANTATGLALTSTALSGTLASAAVTGVTTAGTALAGTSLQVYVGGTAAPISLTIGNVSTATAITALETTTSGIGQTLKNAGITVTGAVGGALTFTDANGNSLAVSSSGDTAGLLGLGTTGGTTFSSTGSTTTDVGATAIVTGNNAGQQLQISLGGAAPITITVAAITDTPASLAATATEEAANINSAITAATGLAGANLTATVSALGVTTLTSSNGTNFSVTSTALNAAGGVATQGVGFGIATSTAVASTDSATVSSAIDLRVQGSGLTAPVDFTLSSGNAVTNLAALQSTTSTPGLALKAAGIVVTLNATTNQLSFTSATGGSVNVSTSGDTSNSLGFGTFASGATSFTSVNGTTPGTDGITGTAPAGAALSANLGQTLQISVAGGTAINISTGALGTQNAAAQGATIAATLNTAIAANATLTAAGLKVTADSSTGALTIGSANGTSFRLNATSLDNTGVAATTATNIGFGTSGNATVAASTSNTLLTDSNISATGSSATAVYAYNPTANQTVGFTAYDASGAAHTLSVSLVNNTATGGTNNAQTIDQAISSINTQLQSSGDATLSTIVAVKADTTSPTGVVTQGIQFISSLASFNVSLGAEGTATSQQGIGTAAQQGTTQVSSAGSQSDISSAAGAQTAVNTLANAVTALGSAQANVGKSENLLNYAVALATTQVTNEAAAESRIRDANLATEAANLSKAQILMQAGTAALAQANSAPQAILSLLK